MENAYVVLIVSVIAVVFLLAYVYNLPNEPTQVVPSTQTIVVRDEPNYSNYWWP